MNLKHCPFCGSDNVSLGPAMITGFEVWCDECGARGSKDRTEELAARYWNQRVNEETLEE